MPCGTSSERTAQECAVVLELERRLGGGVPGFLFILLLGRRGPAELVSTWVDGFPDTIPWYLHTSALVPPRQVNGLFKPLISKDTLQCIEG